MYGDNQSGMQCLECEALLADALDGALHGASLAAFETHQQSCPACHAMVDEATQGMHWLKALDDAEPPKNLVHNILAHTIGTLPSEQVQVRPCETFLDKVKTRLSGIFAPVATPRFAMSFGMAFFSITMLLNVAGFRFADLRQVDLTSKGITKMYYNTQARAVRYYENIRLVYEIESRVRDLRRAATADKQEDNTPRPPAQNLQKEQNQPQREQNRNYEHHSLDGDQPVLDSGAAGSNPVMHQARLNRSES